MHMKRSDKDNKEYNAERIMKALVETAVEAYNETGELKLAAEELSMSALKIRKLLITAGVYHNELSDEVNRLFAEGKSVGEIQSALKLGKSSVNGYLPYTKIVYKTEELSKNACRITVYRERKKTVKDLIGEPCEERLWEAVIAFQGFPFHTALGLPFTYELKRGRDGGYNRELVVSRRKESKTLAWSSIKLAFDRAMEKQGQVIDRPKALGDIRGISYIYPMLYRFGIIEVPNKTAEKMQLKGKRTAANNRR